MHVVNAVDEHAVTTAVELLVELADLVKLSSSVEVFDVLAGEVPLEALNEVVILGLERIPVRQVSRAHTDSQRLARVGGANATLGSANHFRLILLLQRSLLRSISSHLDARDEMSARRKLEAALVVNTVVVELLKLAEHGVDVHDHTIAEQVLALRVQDTAREQVECVLDSISDHCVACVGATIEASAHIVLCG